MQTLVKYAPNASESTLMYVILEGNGNKFVNIEIITAVKNLYIILI